MRLDRAPGEQRESRATPGVATNVHDFIAGRTSFASALQQQRQKAPAQSREARPSSEGDSRRPVSRGTPTTDTSCPIAESDPGEPSELPAFRPMLSILSTTPDAGGMPAAVAAASSAARATWRRSLEEANANACIEVTHSGTGTRFLLSQKNGVWLVSLQDAAPMSASDLESLLQDLRAQFAERGLGEIDVIA